MNACRVIMMKKMTRMNSSSGNTNNSGGNLNLDALQSISIDVDKLLDGVFKKPQDQISEPSDGYTWADGKGYHVNITDSSKQTHGYSTYHHGFKLDYLSNKTLLQQVIRNMIRKTSSPLAENYHLTEDDYQFLMDVIYDNFLKVIERRVQPPEEEKQPIDNNIVRVSFMDVLTHSLASVEGIMSVQTLFMDYPQKVSILIRVDPDFEFRDQQHAEKWERRIADAIRYNKPDTLEKLEVIFHRMEVF